MLELLILCYDCTLRRLAEEELLGAARASDYEQVEPLLEPAEGRVLTCSLWGSRKRHVPASRRSCDDCGQAISVADSSLPLIRASGRT